MAKFHLPRMLYGMDSWKFFVEVVREERYNRAPRSARFLERHFFPTTTGNLESFRKNFPMMVYGAVSVVSRQIADLEVNSRGVTVLFQDGELVEGLET